MDYDMIAGMQYAAALAAAQQQAAVQQQQQQQQGVLPPSNNNTLQSRQFLLQQLSQQQQSHQVPAQQLPIQPQQQPQQQSSPTLNTNHPLVKQHPVLGGSNATNGISVYACLVGKMLDNSSETNELITIPITRLPTTLGKEHNTKDPSFVGLKESTDDKAPKLSQSMCTIFYRDAYGGKLGLYKKGKKVADTSNDPLDGMIYKPHEPPVVVDQGNNEKSSSSTQQPLPDDILRLPAMDSKASLPPNGFYAIECTGRKIMVGGRTIKKGQFAMLSDGMAIKIASYCFYFLLPKVSSINGKPPPSITVQVTTSIKAEKKRRSDSMSSAASVNSVEKDSVLSPQPPPAKKTKTKKTSPQVVAPSASATSSATKDNAAVVHQPVLKPKKKSSGKFDESIFNSKTDMQLLQMLSQKVTAEGSTWDHEAQKLGAAIAQRVCLAASKSPSIISISNTNNGVTQREIVDWMNTSETSIFKEYERMVLSKIEKKSFMTNIGKGMVKVGYTKNAVLSGRSWRFTLPGQPDRNAAVSVVDSGEKKSEAVAEEPKQVAVAAPGGGEKVVQPPPQEVGETV